VSPRAVVLRYYAAINAGDYRKAWEIGGKNLGRPYADFAAGFSGTQHDAVTITGVDGPTVAIQLVVTSTHGQRSTYAGTYTVRSGAITDAHVHRTSAPPASATTKPPSGTACDPSYPDVCLHDGIGDYDCARGSGDGPNYVTGPIRVKPPDPFGLDRDGDGVGCES
jgi:hypothetical protein